MYVEITSWVDARVNKWREEEVGGDKEEQKTHVQSGCYGDGQQSTLVFIIEE